MQRHNNHQHYTHQLPYGVRREICNLLDADQSWWTLGLQLGLDSTSLSLIGQAVMRNGSPTQELINRLDSSNALVSDLWNHLENINHWKALDILRPFLPGGITMESTGHQANFTPVVLNKQQPTTSSTLVTPTPSFADQRMELGQTHFGDNLISQLQPFVPIVPTCHKAQNFFNDSPSKQPSLIDKIQEEKVRLACVNNEKRSSISDQEVVNQLRLIMQINYNELRVASNDFSDSNILGNGGFASVYRGNWKGTDVAIKRLKCNLVDQALNELTILNSYRIDNILPIYGISIDGPEACLVYQFMSNGSLEDRLSCKDNSQPLTWQQRALIGEGLAKGLYYLHTLRDKPLVHGDVKSANVLLDSQFVPKLGDFGLARQVFKNKNLEKELCTHCTVSSIHGTSVYLPEEYLRHRILSPAVDVYSYGIVLLEMGTGKRAFDGKRLLINRVEDQTRSLSKGEIGYGLKDPLLSDESNEGLKIWFELLIKLGLDCAHRIKKKRPDMGQVLSRYAKFRHHTNTILDTDALQNSSLMVVEDEITVHKATNDTTQPEGVPIIPLLTELGLPSQQN